MSPRIVAGTFLIVALTFLSLLGYSLHQKSLRQVAEAAYTQQSVELEGAKRALLVKPSEIIKYVEVPTAVKAAVKSGKMTPIASVKVAATSNTIEVPCPPQAQPLTGPLTDQTASIAQTPAITPVTFDLTGNLFIGKVKAGAVEWTGSLTGVAHNADKTWSQAISFDPAETKIDVRVSSEIAEAVSEHEQSWGHKHFRFMCPGLFIGYNGKATAAVGCGYGIVW